MVKRKIWAFSASMIVEKIVKYVISYLIIVFFLNNKSFIYILYVQI